MESADPPPDTIAAIATPPGRGGIGVVRVSGPQVPAIAQALLGRLPAARQATFGAVRNSTGERIDEALALYFPAPASYTAEDVLEIQGHGSPMALGAVLSACLAAGARLAQPGEFTRRAFLNGKLDLAQAEAVADLIEAATAQAARGAMRSLAGEFSEAIGSLVAALIELRALTEAALDFPEEEIDPLHRNDVAQRVTSLQASLHRVFTSSRQGSLLRAGINIVLAGRPNVGKSSLLNRLAGEERAIVTPIAGTTRDTVRETIAIDGVPLNLIDTAGLRPASDEVERLGIERTWAELGRADVTVMIIDAQAGRTAEDEEILAHLAADAPRILVWNKIDLAGLAPEVRQTTPIEVAVSARTGAGIEGLRRVLLDAAGWNPAGETLFVARERHLRALAEAGVHMRAAARLQDRAELFAEELRLAQGALSAITGEFTADDLLGEIFGRFCIGK
ncbi:MAG: tRNA uridine-5-carboxymethylaminomethyl(34) synthesis GTPase MnmE [Betaproteobacteria bacterium]